MRNSWRKHEGFVIDPKTGQTKAVPIHPAQFYPLCEGYKWFGYMSTQLARMIKLGLVPKPITLPGGRRKGWWGRTIIAWQAEQEPKAAEREARAREERECKKLEREGKPRAKRKVTA